MLCNNATRTSPGVRAVVIGVRSAARAGDRDYSSTRVPQLWVPEVQGRLASVKSLFVPNRSAVGNKAESEVTDPAVWQRDVGSHSSGPFL